MRHLVLLLALLAPTAMAQGDPPADAPEPPQGGWTVWAGAGSSVLSDPLFIGVRLHVDAERQALALRLGYTFSEEFWSSDAAHVLSASAGACARTGGVRFSAIAGPALVWGTAGRPYPRERYTVLGGVAEVGILFPLSTTVDLGLEGQVYANPVFISAGGGFAFRVNLGRVR